MGVIRRMRKIANWCGLMRQAIVPPERKRKTVLIMVSSLYGGGAEKVACTLASSLSGPYRVILLYYYEKEHRYAVDLSVVVKKVPQFPFFNDRNFRRFIRLLKRSARAHCSISFMFESNQLNIETKGSEKAVCCERNNPARKEPQNMATIRELYHRADRVVFQSKQVRDLFDRETREKATILPNPVGQLPRRSPETAPVVFTIGRLHPQKNQAMLLRAFAKFHASRPEYALEIYGEGELQGNLAALASQLGVSDHVRFCGNDPDVHRRVAGNAFFVLSSDYEGFSNALLECMTMGFPCISTACEGATDILEDAVNGLLVPRGDEDGLAAAMEKLAGDRAFAERLGSAAQRASERFRKENVISQWVELIEAL